MRGNAPLLVVLGLGSNLGDSRQIILDAACALGKVLSGLARASLYETEPLYVKDQNRFINTVVSGYSRGLKARELLCLVQKIEKDFGRDRAGERRRGERFLDIDILLYGDLVIKEPDLEIPHPGIRERRFVLEPLLELLPDAAEPGTGISYRSICESLPDQGVRQLTINS